VVQSGDGWRLDMSKRGKSNQSRYCRSQCRSRCCRFVLP
jgi:hypothetical protein